MNIVHTQQYYEPTTHQYLFVVGMGKLGMIGRLFIMDRSKTRSSLAGPACWRGLSRKNHVSTPLPASLLHRLRRVGNTTLLASSSTNSFLFRSVRCFLVSLFLLHCSSVETNCNRQWQQSRVRQQLKEPKAIRRPPLSAVASTALTTLPLSANNDRPAIPFNTIVRNK
jgi:hypothetical protein